MSTWTAKLTKKGNALLSKLVQGNTLEITHAEIGAGTVDILLLPEQTSVSNVKQTAQLQPVAYPEDGRCALPINITNDGVTASFTAWQIGVFANDPDEGSILFFLAQAEDTGTSIPSQYNSSYSTEIIFYIGYGQADSVTVAIDPTNSVTQRGMENYVSTAIVDATQRTITTAGTGEAYTATVPGITALKVGLSFTMIPHVVSTTNQPTLNVNGLGAKAIRQPLTTNTGATTAAALDTWLTAGKPVRVTYDGTLWKIDIPRPSATTLYGRVAMENGGTDADNRIDALVNLHDVPGTPQRADMHYENLVGTGLVSASATTAEVVAAMPTYSQFTWSHTTNTSVYLTDAPATQGICVLIKGYGENYIHGWFLGYDGEIYRYKHHNTNKTKNGWTKVLTNILSPDDYGPVLPDHATPGRLFFLEASSRGGTNGSNSVAVTSYDTLKFSWWENEQSGDATEIGWKLELIATSYGRIDSSTTKPWTVTVNGEEYSGTTSVAIGNNETKTLASGTTTIPHDSSGNTNFSYSFSQEFTGITFSDKPLGNVSGSGSGTLTTNYGSGWNQYIPYIYSG